jgi:hypothetical protein
MSWLNPAEDETRILDALRHLAQEAGWQVRSATPPGT